jgi:ubiquinone/menaquinone biosynthesis C-methylase UbiE
MPDQLLKNLEIENIEKFLENGMSVADIGCGNGYSTFHYANSRKITIRGVDYSETMILNAEKALLASDDEIQKRITFQVGDVRATGLPDATFHAVITDRCLINLTSREDQMKAVREVHRILMPGGLYLMCEDTEQGLARLNNLREYMGLEAINVRWHNLYLDEAHILSGAQGIFELLQTVNFSSFYYVASRIINAKIAQEQGVEPQYDSDINRVAAMCSSLGGFGDFGPLKLFVFKKPL